MEFNDMLSCAVMGVGFGFGMSAVVYMAGCGVSALRLFLKGGE